jgi:RHS repeat-associated protein
MPGRGYTAPNQTAYRYGFNGKENDNDVKGTGNQQDYGMRIYDPRLGRFLSVDPLTSSYPMLTPYQFASNRPIDGIDLDGKEWMKTEQYDPKTGIMNVHFHVKLKVANASSVFKISQDLRDEVSSQFGAAFANSYHNDSKTNFSASIELEEINSINIDKDFGVELYNTPKPSPGFNAPLGSSPETTNTQINNFSVLVEYTDPNNPEKAEVAFSNGYIAQTIIHELGHTAGVKHPMQPNGAADVQLMPYPIKLLNGKMGVAYKPAIESNLDLIIKNIMVYGSTKVNGKPVKEHEPDWRLRGNFSPDQSKEIQKEVLNEKDK